MSGPAGFDDDATSTGATTVDRASSADAFSSISEEVPKAIVGRYELYGMLGAGGMGTVFAAHDRDLGERVALKVLSHIHEENAQMLELFRQEVRLARRVTHPNVARVFDIGVTEDFAFLTMELIEGVSLSSLAHGPLDPRRVIEIGLALCAALGAAHTAGVLHCDLKPANVICAHDGRYVVTDFGIARALRLSSRAPDTSLNLDGIIIGTPPFMSPEQLAGESLDERTDIFALGVTLFRLLTGKMPWRESTSEELRAARSSRPLPDPRELVDVPAPLADVVRRCLTLRREDRLASARQLADALRAVATAVSHGPVRAPAPRTPIAVLPVHGHEDAADHSLASGLVDEIGEHLSASPELAVTHRSIVQSSAKTSPNARALARALRVDYAVTGELSFSEGCFHLEARLVSVANWRTVLALNLDFEAADLFLVAQRTARLVALTLEQQTSTHPMASGEAADLFLRGRSLYRSLEDGTPLLERAHALAPTDARIAATYALALARRETATDSLAHARAIADRAIELDPNLSDARLAIALLHLYEGEARSAALALRRAYALEPTNVDVLTWIGRLLAEAGALQEGMAKLERAIALAPGGGAVETKARVLALLGRTEEAVAVLEAGRELLGTPYSYLLARLHLWRPNSANEAKLHAGVATLPPETHHRLEFLLALARGEPVSDEALARHLAFFTVKGSPRRAAFDLQRRIEFFVSAKRFDQAETELARLEDQSFIDLSWIDGCPLLVPLRGRPALAQLRRTTSVRAARVRDALMG